MLGHGVRERSGGGVWWAKMAVLSHGVRERSDSFGRERERERERERGLRMS